MTQQDCTRESPALSDPATANDEFLITGRVPVIGKIVAGERVVGRQPAEAVACQWRQSGLEVELQYAGDNVGNGSVIVAAGAVGTGLTAVGAATIVARSGGG